MSLLLGYNTNGFAHHRLEDALDLIAGIGYRSVGLTIDVHHAPPGATDYARLGREIADRGLVPVVETGSRFLLDPSRKHWPTLLTPDRKARQRRLDFYFACIDAAAALGAPCISLWSGRDEGDDASALLLEGLGELCERGTVAFEPEPGMLVATMAQFDALAAQLPALKLTLDVGHIHCLESERPESVIARYAPVLANVHLDDHQRGVHDHLMFGEGEIDWPPLLRALRAVPGALPATVELSRHSHNAVASAQQAHNFLTR